MPPATQTEPAPPRRDCDLAVLGGGLAGSLIALAMARHRPDLSVLLIERGERLGGDHVWSLFATDMDKDARELLEPAIAARWPGYEVRFPGMTRKLGAAYASVTSERLDAAVRTALAPSAVLSGTEVEAAGPDWVRLAGGLELRCGAVIDARGASAMPGLVGGYQLFCGQMLRLKQPHGLAVPIVMDATVEQLDGYRFVYALPFAADRLFVEDTYYADGPALDGTALHDRIAGWCAAQGFAIAEVLYEEQGVLPVIAGGSRARFMAEGAPGAEAGTPRAGVRAALVHPLTSYSLPDALAFALHLSRLDNLSAERLGCACETWAAAHWRKGRFYRMLTRMLFGAARPEARWRVLARFYRLPEPLIERFYAGRSTLADKVRVLAGKPPVPLVAAVKTLLGGGRPLADLGTGKPAR